MTLSFAAAENKGQEKHLLPLLVMVQEDGNLMWGKIS